MGACLSAAVLRVAFIVWDIENVRVEPTASWGPVQALRAVRREFVTAAGFTERQRAVCAVTPASMEAMSALLPRWLDDLVPEMAVLMASNRRRKRGADYALLREFSQFVDLYGHLGPACKIVLLTGDEDFLGPVQAALRRGVDVQLIHPARNTSGALLALPYPALPVIWESISPPPPPRPALVDGPPPEPIPSLPSRPPVEKREEPEQERVEQGVVPVLGVPIADQVPTTTYVPPHQRRQAAAMRRLEAFTWHDVGSKDEDAVYAAGSWIPCSKLVVYCCHDM